MALRVLFGGAYRAAGEVEALRNSRTYKRDKEENFPSGGGFAKDADIRAAFKYADPKSGFKAKVVGIDRDNVEGGGAIEVEVSIRDRSGAEVGTAWRMIYPPTADAPGYVVHDSMVLKPGTQGTGFGARFNAHAEAEYRRQGMDRVELHANIDVGGYAWARQGYDFKPTAEDGINHRANLADHARTRASGYGEDVRREIDRIASNPASLPADFAMVGHTPGATTWPGKEIMLGSSWGGVKQL